MSNLKYFIVISGSGPQAGKTAVRKYLGEKLGVPHCATSDMILPHLEVRRGIPAEQVKLARRTNPEAYRKDLIEVAEELQYEFGVSLTLDAYWAGYVVVDGARKVDELQKARKKTESDGAKMLHIHLFRDSSPPTDNTDPAIGTLANVVFRNDGTLEQLQLVCWTVVEGFVNKVNNNQPGTRALNEGVCV